MNPAENSFRTAVVGGFNRQDVLNYIESSARESKERVAALQKEAEEAKQAGEAARREVDAAKGREDVLKRDLERLQKAEAEKSASLESAQSDLEQVRRELAELREALGALKDKAARWESGAKAYAELKDRTATIELEAHQRARAIEKEAEEKARRAREAAEQLLCRIRSGYERLRTDVDATITHASGELGRVDKALECVKAEFAEHDAALEQLLLSYQEESGGRKAPEPLPLEES